MIKKGCDEFNFLYFIHALGYLWSSEQWQGTSAVVWHLSHCLLFYVCLFVLPSIKVDSLYFSFLIDFKTMFDLKMSFQFDISLKTDHQASRKNIFPLKLKKGIEVPVKSNNTYLSILASNITLSKMLYIWWVTFSLSLSLSLSLFLPYSLLLSLSLTHLQN